MKKLILAPALVLMIVGLIFIFRDSTDQYFMIGLFAEQTDLLKEDLTSLEEVTGKKIRIKYYDDEALMNIDIKNHTLDLYSCSTFFYLEHQCPGKIISSFPSAYYLLGRVDAPTSGKLEVGTFEYPISTLLLNHTKPLFGSIIANRTYLQTQDRYKALLEGTLDYAVFRHENPYNKFNEITKISDCGYTKDVLILSDLWVDPTDFDLLRALNHSLQDGLVLPNEEETKQVIGFLFAEEKITQRVNIENIFYTPPKR